MYNYEELDIMDNIKEDIIKIKLPNGSIREYKSGISLLELSREFEPVYLSAIIAGKVNNEIRELGYVLTEDCKVEFIDLTHTDGFRIYQRSLCFVLIKAVNNLYPDRKVIIEHSISKGLYCEIIGEKELDASEVKLIENRMREIVDAKLLFIKRTIPSEEAEELFLKSGRRDRYDALKHRMKPYVTLYTCDGFEDYFYGYMAPHTGYVERFSLRFYPPGLILRYPERSAPEKLPEFEEQKKLFSIFSEFKRWNRILGVDNVGFINDIVKKGDIKDFIRISEALHEKKIARIADMISNSRFKKRVILISGPSSSGKTTFAQRLSIQLRVNGLRPVTISIDDYFVNRERTPFDENGDRDYESLEAIDIDLFNRHLGELIDGIEVEVPIYSFTKGEREDSGRSLKIGEDEVLVIEGIHGLNDRLTPCISPENKFKIYVSALTSINIDNHNRIPSTDTRILRRTIRDHRTRGCDALNTINRWPSVRRGEKKNIFPFQEQADVMFNSSLPYELGVLKTFAEPLLSEITNLYGEYSEAKRLLEFLSYFLPVDTEEIPANSIIKEFIGGSCFST
jgi:uridine kinase